MALVVWSGGCDSTLVLHDVAKELGNARALSIRHCQVLAQEELATARVKLLAKLGKRGVRIEHTTLTVEMDNYAVQAESHDGCNPQPVLWLSAAVSHLQQDEDLYFGYHRGDDFWRNHLSFQRAFEALQAIRNGKGQLRFPLEGLWKTDIIKRLKGLRLYRDCWYCETPTPKSKPCKKCRPCITHRTALWQLSEGMA